MKNKFLFLKLLSLILVFVFCFSLASCGNKQEGETDNTDGGDVSQNDSSPSDGIDVGEFKDILDDNGKVIGQEIYFTDGNLKYRENYNYKGDVSESILYNKDGTSDVEEKRTYNDDGSLLQIITKKFYYENGSLKEYNVSYFNGNMWCMSTYSYNADNSSQGFTSYERDALGNVTVESVYGPNMALDHVNENEYSDADHPNLPTRETVKDSNGKVLSISLSEYNEKGLISRLSECDENGNVRNYCDYIYGEDGVLSEQQVYVSDGQGGFIRYS